MNPPEDGEDFELVIDEEPEYLGDFSDLDSYFRNQLAELMHPAIHWILDIVDLERVRERFEASRHRYFIDDGKVYRETVRTP